MDQQPRRLFPHAQRYLLTGLLALTPIWITWLVFNFALGILSGLGRPWVQGFAKALGRVAPGAAELLLRPWFESALAVALTLVGLYALGWATSRVFGKRLLAWFESLVARVPLVSGIYGAAKKVLAAFQTRPEGVQRVVLINFPSREMKAVGLVTRTLVDERSGRELAAVFVPTSPNPTSGYMEIVPLEHVVPTDWTIEEAMRFIITGGTSAPNRIPYDGAAVERRA
jgi:uncharacterized membrane protein